MTTRAAKIIFLIFFAARVLALRARCRASRLPYAQALVVQAKSFRRMWPYYQTRHNNFIDFIPAILALHTCS